MEERNGKEYMPQAQKGLSYRVLGKEKGEREESGLVKKKRVT